VAGGSDVGDLLARRRQADLLDIGTRAEAPREIVYILRLNRTAEPGRDRTRYPKLPNHGDPPDSLGETNH
jgi:hypothetical protein